MKIRLLIAVLISTSFLSACKQQDENIEEIKTIQLDEKSAKVVEADNQFGLELFQKISASETEADNIMISPLSVALALAMTYNGAEGETKTAMEKTLKKHGLTADEINASYKTLVNALKSLDSKVILEIANAIYYRDNFDVEKNFVSLNREFYDAEVSPLDFNATGEALATINGWVAQKTHDKIESIINEISPTHVMFLLNAIYFKGIWQKEFNEKSTIEQDFFPDNGSSIQVEMMCKTDTLEYTSNSFFSAIKMPYGNGNYNMLVFLPETGKTTKDIISELNTENWNKWQKAFQLTKDLQIQFPKFKFEYEKKLNDVLTEMGMGVAFSGAADFRGINKGGGLKIDYVKHKTFIEVKEEGTEAAAVTVVAIELTSAGPGKSYIPFYVNRSFLFAITEKDTGAILFIGEVKRPVSE
jgi:serpin B